MDEIDRMIDELTAIRKAAMAQEFRAGIILTLDLGRTLDDLKTLAGQEDFLTWMRHRDAA